EVGNAVVVEVGEHGTDLARRVADAGILDVREARLAAVAGVEEEHARAGAVEEVGLAVAVDVADGERVTLDAGGKTVGAEADLSGHIPERLLLRRRRLDLAGLEVERPVAVALADLEEQMVLAGLELERRQVLVRSAAAIRRVGQDLLAVEPHGQRVVAPE